MITMQSKRLLALTTICLTILLVIPFGYSKNAERPTVRQEVEKPDKDTAAEEESALTFGNVAHISDIHFNPFYDPTLVAKLFQSDALQWESIFAASKVKGYGIYGKNETNYNLLISSLKNMATNSKPDFIIFTGDFLAHEFNERFEDNGGEQDKYDNFVDNTITFIVLMFKKYFPDKPVYISLGNNDSYAGDYKIIPDGAFLHNSASILSANFLENPENQKSFGETYPFGGYFTVTPPGSQNTLIITLNSIFFSVKHTNPKGLDYDPAEKELNWFEKQLKGALQNNQKVWLLLHIPPGINVYSTVRDKKYISMWKPQYNDRFIQLLEAYGSVITAIFCGHTHMDDFRLLVDSKIPDKAISFVRICPAISPQFGNNPGYEHLFYDPLAFKLINYELYYLNLDIADPAAVQWQKEYSFDDTYGQAAITAPTLLTVYNALNTNPAMSANYIEYYNVGHISKPGITEATWKSYWCGIGNWTQTAFESCSGNN